MNNNLKVLRAMRSWSQQDLADRLGVSRQSVNAIEKGRYDPSLPLAFTIADVFELPIEEIFSRDCSIGDEVRSGLGGKAVRARQPG